MGTVGISFGSPTSGQGFDVASTVSQIVANLQAVETPWSNQLTSLESQDSALTSLGSDLSTLTSALETLTDFDGVLSEKEGSSSDTSVLTLASASSSAVSGTHTVIVNNLAQTSTYYSDAVGSSDLLTGTLSITVNGSNESIALGSGETLSGLASTINEGNYGVTANVITESSGQQVLSLVSSTSGAAGEISLDGTSVTDSASGSTVNFTEAQAGEDASLTVDGVTVTSSSNTVTDAISGVTMQLLNASATGAAAVQVVVTNDNSDVETAVSNFVSAYNAVMGDINTQEGNDASGNAEPLFGSTTLANIQEQLQQAFNFTTAKNAAYTSSSISSTDVFSGSVSISVGSGDAVTVDMPSGSGTLSDLAAAINAKGIGVTANVVTSGSTEMLSLVNSTTGATISVDGSNLNDTTAGTTGTSFISSNTGGLTSITQLGISVNNDGTLSLNVDTLESELNSNYAGITNFFQESTGFTSFGGNLTTVLNTLGSSDINGEITLKLAENSSVESQLESNITKENAIISTEQTSLTAELNAANETLEEIPEQINEVNELYSAITGYNENN